MNEPTRLLYVDYQQVLLETLPKTLEQTSRFRVVGTAHSGFDALDLLREERCDLMILEPRVPDKDPIDLVKDLLAHHADLRLLILSADETPIQAYRMLRAGAAGWIGKSAPFPQLIEALEVIAAGKVFLPKSLKSMFAEKYVHPESDGDPKGRLTDREYQVSRMLAMGHTNHEIAAKLYIGVKTVDTHRANLLRKLGLRNNADVARFAIQYGLIEI